MTAVISMGVSDGLRHGEVAFGGIAFQDPAPRADPLRDLLRTIAEVLDIREVFPRVSEIARQVVAHDYMTLTAHDEEGRLTLQAQSAQEMAPDDQITDAERGDFCLVSDLRASYLRHRGGAEQFIAAGFLSFLSVRTRAGNRIIRLGLFAKRPAAFDMDDVPDARRVANCLAVIVSHEQLVTAERGRLEARGRHGSTDGLIRPLASAAERKPTEVRPVGESPTWRAALGKATQVASTETTVVLQGESGTGKEVLARYIHRTSPRRNSPFVAINCAALPDQLLESELFGYERGAFTGAQQSKPGQIEMAAGGVLFLDEVSEMSPAAQAKLLRVLQEREFQRLGGTRLVKANVRVIAASNRDLAQAVAAGAFREDLYYRLHVFDIHLPPLRERLSDIPLLAEAFLDNLSRSMGRAPIRLAPSAADRLLAHDWPGNVRELQNALERAAILCDEVIQPEDLSLQPAAAGRTNPGTDLVAVERQTIERVLQDADGNKTRAARHLGITRTQLYVRLRRYGLGAPGACVASA